MKVKTNPQFEQDLFSSIDFEEKLGNELHEKMIEYRKNTKFTEDQLEQAPDFAPVELKEKKAEPAEMKEKKTYTKYNVDEIRKSTAEYFHGDNLAADVWMNKYALKDSDGNIYELTPDDMHHRIASEVARIEKRYPNPLSEEQVFEVLKDFRYIVPQGSPMAGIGNDFQISSLSNCFVIGTIGSSDSYGAIM